MDVDVDVAVAVGVWLPTRNGEQLALEKSAEAAIVANRGRFFPFNEAGVRGGWA